MKTERRCGNCAYARRLASRWLRVILSRWPGLLICFHHAASPGTLSEVTPWSRCRNFRPRRRPTVRIEPPDPSDPGVRYISLTKGKYAIVDAADYPALARYKWHAHGEGQKLYACRTCRGRLVAMHRQIMKPPEGMVVDHINGNGLDNRRCNLRVCSQLQNSQNSHRRRPGKSRFRGVFPRGDKFEAHLQHDGRLFYLGLFHDEAEAARARDRRALELAGKFAVLNFPDEAQT